MKEKIKQLEYLHPKVIASAFYIHSGEDLKDQLERIKVVPDLLMPPTKIGLSI